VPADIEAAFQAAIAKFGRVDVVCNNAGYGLAGFFEETTEEQIRMQMEVNFFGLMAVTRKAIEVMRTQSPAGGLIQQVTSVGGQRAVMCFSSYCASKWAVEGFTEAVAQEMKPEWRIKLTCIEPGGFRTNWAGASMKFADRHPAYDQVDAKAFMTARNGTQKGDPVKGGKAMYEIACLPFEEMYVNMLFAVPIIVFVSRSANSSNRPLRLCIGSDAHAVCVTFPFSCIMYLLLASILT
jgi:NAD(P)-dependent dehydrogenase (short-subunit alcohol dehydrogenase family)